MKLVSVSKKELIFELILKDNIPVEALWWFGWGLARHFVVALNIGTMGFWWWRRPEQISRFYESIEDLDKKMKVFVERSPALKIDWGPNRVLTEEDLHRAALCMAALPGPHQRDQHKAYNYYIGGLTFLSLNDIHWQCESTVFGNFLECLKAMMEGEGDWKPDTSFKEAALRFLDDMFPGMDEREHFADLCARFEAKTPDIVIHAQGCDLHETVLRCVLPAHCEAKSGAPPDAAHCSPGPRVRSLRNGAMIGLHLPSLR